MIQNRRAYQLIHCHTRSRLLAGAAAVCGAACGHADLGLYHLLHRGGAPLPDSTQADRAALAALCPKPAAEETCPLLPQQDPAVTLSVIVPVYNGEATIGPCLDSILQQETSCTVQLIVVDSDSTDGTAAVQSYWIMEQLAVQDAALGLPHDALYRCTLTLQLSAFCYATVSGLPPETQQAVFRLCCALYAKALPQEGALPRRARWGARALRQQDFGLWCRYGRRFQLL